MITIKTAVITRSETLGMIQLEKTVITAWARQPGAGMLHGTQHDFPLGTGETEIFEKINALWQERVKAFNRLDKRYKEHHA